MDVFKKFEAIHTRFMSRKMGVFSKFFLGVLGRQKCGFGLNEAYNVENCW